MKFANVYTKGLQKTTKVVQFNLNITISGIKLEFFLPYKN